MKTSSPKNIAIGMLLLSNIAMGAYIFARQPSTAEISTKAKADALASPARKGLVQEGSLKNNKDLQNCYEVFLARNPVTDEGIVEMRWMLETSGKISDIQLIKTDLPDQELMECLMGRLNVMTFRAPASAKLVAHKFTFKKKSPGSVSFQ